MTYLVIALVLMGLATLVHFIERKSTRDREAHEAALRAETEKDVRMQRALDEMRDEPKRRKKQPAVTFRKIERSKP